MCAIKGKRERRKGSKASLHPLKKHGFLFKLGT